MRVMCVILPLLACGEDLPAHSDLSGVDDLSVAGDLSRADDLSILHDLAAADFVVAFPDLRQWHDLAYPPVMPVDPPNYCGGPDGGLSCAQSFFLKLAVCYRPGGPCSGFAHNSGVYTCWQSGAASSTYWWSLPEPSITYYQDKLECARRAMPASGLETWQLWDGSMLTVDPASGDVACPDGTHTNVGPSYSACPALQQLLEPCDNPGADPPCP